MNQKIFNELKDENGQVSFADAVYYDPTMNVLDKVFWLTECAKLPNEDQRADAENYLDQLCRACGSPDCMGGH